MNYKEALEFYKPKEPTKEEVFDALAGNESPDWCIRILEKADPKRINEVRTILAQGLPFSEAEIEVNNLPDFTNS